MANLTLELLIRATTHAVNTSPATPELSAPLEKVPLIEIESLITGFDALITSFNNTTQLAGDHLPLMNNTRALKEATPTLPTVNEMMEGEHGERVGMATLRLFRQTTADFKQMVDKGSVIANLNPGEDMLVLDEKNPDALFFHREPGAPENGLVFGTTLHILEMYFNKRFSNEFATAKFEPRKDWLLDMCMEQMIINEGLGANRNLQIHQLFDLVNNQLGWLEGYPNIDPELRKMAILEPLRESGLEPVILDKSNFAKDSPIVSKMVDFDKLCFGENPTGSKNNLPPLMTREDIINGIQESENKFVILMKDQEVVAILQYSPRAKDQSMHIMSLAVHPDSRGMGIAKKLKIWVEAETEAQGIDKVTTRIDPNNQPIVHENFKRQFVVVGARNRPIKGHPNSVTTLALTKLLKPPAMESIIDASSEPKSVSITDQKAIDALASVGYRGTQIEADPDGTTTLIMHKMNKAGLEAYPYWT